MSEDTAQSALFPDVFEKPVHVEFDEPAATSDGGAVLLGALDRTLGLTESLTGCIRDRRDPSKVEHSIPELIQQRVYAIALGYPDCNDAARLRHDSMQRTLVGRDPILGGALASQPTLSRFENSVSGARCFRLGLLLAELVLLRHRKRLKSRIRKVKRVRIDLDGSVDPTHGQQQLSIFNGFYDTWCFFPLFAFISFDDEAEQYLLAAILRSGVAKEIEGTLGLLKRLVPALRKLFPRAKIRVRLDAGFQGPELFDLLDALGVEYVVAMAKNPVLSAFAADSMIKARSESLACGETVQLYGEAQYSARSWKRTVRRVVYKAECIQSPIHEPKDNVRFVVTNLSSSPKNTYREYCQRGDCENRIKELKEGLQIDRTSCHAASANQFRLILAVAAFILFQELRLRSKRTCLATAQVEQLRLILLKIGGVIKRSTRRITLHLSEAHPWRALWYKVAKACGAICPAPS